MPPTTRSMTRDGRGPSLETMPNEILCRILFFAGGPNHGAAFPCQLHNALQRRGDRKYDPREGPRSPRATLAAVCSRLRPIAEREVWREIWLDRPRLKRLRRYITRHPSRQLHIRTIDVKLALPNKSKCIHKHRLMDREAILMLAYEMSLWEGSYPGTIHLFLHWDTRYVDGSDTIADLKSLGLGEYIGMPAQIPCVGKFSCDSKFSSAVKRPGFDHGSELDESLVFRLAQAMPNLVALRWVPLAAPFISPEQTDWLRLVFLDHVWGIMAHIQNDDNLELKLTFSGLNGEDMGNLSWPRLLILQADIDDFWTTPEFTQHNFTREAIVTSDAPDLGCISDMPLVNEAVFSGIWPKLKTFQIELSRWQKCLGRLS